jgi:hypothetical protein
MLPPAEKKTVATQELNWPFTKVECQEPGNGLIRQELGELAQSLGWNKNSAKVLSMFFQYMEHDRFR